MKNFKILNIASGKGGTGKTLFCAILADLLGNRGLNILIVDFDFFVRGLTTLLYFHKKEALFLVDSEQITVSDLFVNKNCNKEINHLELGISRYRSFDVLPAVSRVDELLNYDDIMPDNLNIAEELIEKLISKIPEKYDLVIFDSRSGYDELIAGIHNKSSLTLCIEEEDQISRITADNLIKQLQKGSNTPILRLINKARNIESQEDLEKSKRSINEIGPIPFDIDVLKCFGEQNFWEIISPSLYIAGAIKSWNKLCVKMSYNFELKDNRVRPLPSRILENKLSLFGRYERVFLVYGIFTSIFGLFLSISGTNFLYILRQEPIRLGGIGIGIAGILMVISILLKSKK